MELPVEAIRITVTEYLRLEQQAEQKHEYRDGEVVAMAGGSEQHSLIAANVIGELRHRLRGTPCRVYDSNLRVQSARRVLYSYPDAMVVCGPSAFDAHDPQRGTITNPRLIVEVLSPSTEGFDRGDKFMRYREIETMEEYVLVSQQTPRIETFLRLQDGGWLLRASANIEASVTLASLKIELPLAEVYAGVTFEATVNEA